MTRAMLGAVMIAINMGAVGWIGHHRPGVAAAAFPAIIAGVIVGAIMQRVLFGPTADWQARLHPAVVLAALLAFDLVLFGADTLRAG